MKKTSKIKVGICVDNNLYDLESINESVKEVKVITKPLFFENGFKNFSTTDFIKMGDKGFSFTLSENLVCRKKHLQSLSGLR